MVSSRKKQKYPALYKQYNLRSRSDLIDYDYLHKLNPKELEFLNNFTETEIVAAIDKDSTLSPEEKRRIYGRNNSRNRDFYAKRMKLFIEDLKTQLSKEKAGIQEPKSDYDTSSPKVKFEINNMTLEEFDVFFTNNPTFFSKRFREIYEAKMEKLREDIHTNQLVDNKPDTDHS